MFADLHIHTYMSDGAQSPEEVVKEAARRGLSAISVCDHNLITAYDRLRPACRAAGMKLIQGVEIDTRWRGVHLHVLGYGFDPENQSLLEMIGRARAQLEHVSTEMICEMEKEYPEISLADFQAYQMPLGRGGWKGINYLMDKGLADSLLGAISFHERYTNGFEPEYPGLSQVCAQVRAAGGVPVLAHPCNWWPQPPQGFEAILEDLRQHGIGGIECHYPGNSKELTQICAEFCRKYRLAITCGGDGHGEFETPEYGIGVMRVPMDQLCLEGMSYLP